VQESACWALGNLAINAGNQVKIAGAGGIEAVVATMEAHKTSVLVQEQACAALRILVINDGNKLKIAEAGGIEAVVAAMKAHKTSVFVQKYACWALWYLTAQDSRRQRIKTAGGVECVKPVINASNATSDTKSWGLWQGLLARLLRFTRSCINIKTACDTQRHKHRIIIFRYSQISNEHVVTYTRRVCVEVFTPCSWGR
jgi:hypothetical protein